MPLFSFFLTRLGIVTAARLRAWRKYAILGSFIVAALLTPPEVYTQCLLAGPLILLYEASILVAAAAAPRKR
jgi:sec-independent protein translocase protein TatC